MEQNDLDGYKRLLAAIFGEEPYGLYPFIMWSGNEIPISQVIEEALDSLPLSQGVNDSEPWKRGKKVLELRFGIGTKTHTLDEIAAQLRVVRERIRQLEAKHIRILRHPSRSRRLRLLCMPSPYQFAEICMELEKSRQEARARETEKLLGPGE